MEKFIKYTDVHRYKGIKIAMEDESLKKYLKDFKNLDKLKEDAIKAQKEFTPSFSYEHDKFERKWTKLDLRSIANKRDSLVPKEPLIKHPLEREYVSIYKVASSVIHAECDSLSHSFLDFFPSLDGSPILMPIPIYASIIVAFNASYDILQCHEILNRVGISPGEQYIDLMDEWFKVRDEYDRKN